MRQYTRPVKGRDFSPKSAIVQSWVWQRPNCPFLTYAYERTRDLRAVAELGLHADLKTTQRYTEASVTETARKAVSLLK